MYTKSIIIIEKIVKFTLRWKFLLGFLNVLSTSIEQVFASELAPSSIQDAIEKNYISKVNFSASETKTINQMIQHISGKSTISDFFSYFLYFFKGNL